ncbi:hypothetical protein ACJX0J_034100, partial [Zea mays]
DIDKYCMFAQHQIMKGWVAWLQLANSSLTSLNSGLAVSFSSSMGIIGDGKILQRKNEDYEDSFSKNSFKIWVTHLNLIILNQNKENRQFSLVAGHIRLKCKTIDCRDAASKKQSIHRILQLSRFHLPCIQTKVYPFAIVISIYLVKSFEVFGYIQDLARFTSNTHPTYTNYFEIDQLSVV